MIRNYLLIAYRNLVRNKIYSLINIFGLAIGMAACFFIFQYVHFESNYDRFNKNAGRLYRVPLEYTGSLENYPISANNSPGVGPAMKNDFPEVTDFTRIVNFSIFLNTTVLSYQPGNEAPRSFNETRLFLADGSFFNLFSYPLLSGNPKTCLTDPHSIVLSQTEALKYFGNSDPIGKTMTINGRSPLTVTGVVSDVPENSHIKFDALISFSTIGPDWGYNEFDYPEFYNYVLLAPGTDPKKIEARFPDFIQKHMGTLMKAGNYGCHFYLQPVTDIHLNSHYQKEAEANGSRREISFLSIIGIFILVIAWINYINLSTAKSMERAKEVGLRKVVGAAKLQLFTQFLLESIIINVLALFLAVSIVLLFMPFFQQFLGKDINTGFFTTGLGGEQSFWLILSALFLTGSLLVGAYPAMVLSSFRPATVLKGLIVKSTTGISLRRILVSFQFILSIVLIAATLIVYQQLHYMRQGNLGYQKDQVLILKSPPIDDSGSLARFSFFKTALRANPAVTDVSSSSDIPGAMIRYQNTVRRTYQDRTSNFTSNLLEIDENFITTYQVPLAAGRNFRSTDSARISAGSHINVLINEVLAKAMGFKTPQAAVNENIIFLLGTDDVFGRIVGVMKNFHQRSLKENYDAILCYYPSRTDWKYISIHLNTLQPDNHFTAIEKLYKNTFEGNPFEYFFLDDYFNRQYQSDQRLGNVFFLFGILAILVACLGLLGLSSFIIKLRVKEIGIRKVLGASISSILVLFSKDYIKLISIASLISIPVIYYTAYRWLESFPFHMRLEWFLLIIPSLILLLLSLMTICFQSMKAALENPVKSLRAE